MQKNDWRANALICLYVVIISGSMGKVIPLITAIDSDIGTRPAQSAWLISVMSAVGIVIAPLGGRLTLRFADHTLITAGVAIGMIGSIVAAFGSSFVMILAGRLIEGVAFFLILNSAMTLLMTVNDGPNRARALSLYVASIPVGIGLFSALSAQVSGGGWRPAFLLHAAILAAALLLTRLLPRATRGDPETGAAGAPATPFRRLPPICLGLAMALAGSAQFSAGALLPTYLVQTHGLGLVQSASIGSVGLVIGIAGNLTAGYFLGRGVRATVIVAGALAVAGVAGVVTFLPAAGVAGSATAYILLLLFGGAANSAIVSFGPLVVTDPARLGQSNAIINQVNNGGMLFAAPLIFFAYTQAGDAGPRALVLACAALPLAILYISGLVRLDTAATRGAKAVPAP